MTDEEKHEMMVGMDSAAARAAGTLEQCKTAEDIFKWYAGNYLMAGHKRLGRILAGKGKELKG